MEAEAIDVPVAEKQTGSWKRPVKKAFLVAFLIFAAGSLFLGYRFVGAYRHARQLVRTMNARDLVHRVVPTRGSPRLINTSRGATPRMLGSYDKIPRYMRDAIVAAEDKNFWHHNGVDPEGIARAAVGTARDLRISSGGSTITMQLAKRLYSNSSKTLDRKMQDMAVAIAIERRYSKKQILTFYLDQVYFGAGAYGVQAASLTYFGKTISRCTLGECAMLARCVQRPNAINPIKDLKRSTENRNTVLQRMLDLNMISQQEYDGAVAEEPRVQTRFASLRSIRRAHRMPSR